MSSTLSRRATIVGAVALPAAAMPLPALSADNDAELLRLGAELDAVIVEWHAQRGIDEQERAAHEAACDAAGLPKIEFGSIPDEEWRAHNDKRMALHQSDDPELERWDRIHGKMWPAIDAIIALKATTVAGLAVKARAVSLSFAELWNNETDWEDHHRRFIEAVCAFTGVTPVPLEVQS
jgi:hypothetical protein